MKRSFKTLGIMLLSAIALVACKAKVDLGNIDPTLKLEMGLAVPVGTIKTTLGDFLRIDTMSAISLADDGTYIFQQNMQMGESFQFDMDLASLVQPEDAYFKVKDQIEPYIVLPDSLTIAFSELPADKQQEMLDQLAGADAPDSLTLSVEDIRAQIPDADRLINDYIFSQGFVSTGQEIDLHYPIIFDMKDVMLSGSQRLDSVSISVLDFVAKIATREFDIPFSFFQEMSIDLPDNIRPANGQKHIEIPLGGLGFNQDINVQLRDFMLDLSEQSDITMALNFRMYIPKDYVMYVNEQSAIHYYLALASADYEAIYGNIGESINVAIDSSFTFNGIWEYFGENICLPVAEPKIEMTLAHNIAAPLKATISKLDAYNSRGEITHAQFNGASSYVWNLNSPDANAPLSEMAYSTITLDKNIGTLDKLIAATPQRIGIGLNFGVDESQSATQRLSKNTQIQMETEVTLPFTFNQGIHLAYKDTVAVEFNGINFDSIAALESLEVQQVQIVAIIRSYIPFDISAKYLFLDKNGAEMKLNLVEGNELLIAAPTAYDAQGQASAPGLSTIVVTASPEQVEYLKQIDKLVFELGINDVDQNKLQNKEVTYPVALSSHTAVELQLSVTANAAAYLKLELGTK